MERDLLKMDELPAWISRGKSHEQVVRADNSNNFGALQALFGLEHGSGDVEQEFNFDAVDNKTLSQFISSFDADQFKMATRFISGKEGAFKKCHLPSKTNSPSGKVSQGSAESFNRLIKELTYMSDEEDLIALKNMLQYRKCSKFHFDFVNLGSNEKSVERLLKEFEASDFLHLEGRQKRCKGSRFVRMMRRSTSRHWPRLVLRYRLYQQYFINRLFSSANCIITCWLLCFCASLFH